jgi:hypothetical protein
VSVVAALKMLNVVYEMFLLPPGKQSEVHGSEGMATCHYLAHIFRGKPTHICSNVYAVCSRFMYIHFEVQVHLSDRITLFDLLSVFIHTRELKGA